MQFFEVAWNNSRKFQQKLEDRKEKDFMHICDISYSVKISLRISAKQELFGNSKIRKFSSQETPDSTGSRYEHVRLRVPQESYSQAPTAFRVIFEFETWQMIHCLRTAAKIPSFDAMLPLNAVQRNRVNPDFMYITSFQNLFLFLLFAAK